MRLEQTTCLSSHSTHSESADIFITLAEVRYKEGRYCTNIFYTKVVYKFHLCQFLACGYNLKFSHRSFRTAYELQQSTPYMC
jgi:hypothetical protein